MDKQQLLKDYKKQEDKMCLSQLLDKIEFSKNRDKIEIIWRIQRGRKKSSNNLSRKI